nr:MAG TPA: hypothetical protein [Caudoviricetes sp.]
MLKTYPQFAIFQKNEFLPLHHCIISSSSA